MSSKTDHEKKVVKSEPISHSKSKHTPNVTREARSPGTHARQQHAVTEGEVDDTTVFYNLNKDKTGTLTPEDEKRLVRKNFWFLLGQTWWIAFLIHLDKSTLSQASTMGIFKDVEMTKKQYNDLFVVFYTGYLIALWPGAWLSQRTGQKQFIVGSLLLWAFLLGMHPLAKTGKELMALRFILGMVCGPLFPLSQRKLRLLIFPKHSDRVADRSEYHNPSSGVFPSQEVPMGPTSLVGFGKLGQCLAYHGRLQAYSPG